MLALRLARGSHPLVLLRRLLVAAASAGVGFLFLCTLGYAVGHPGGSLLRLLWCAVPLAATVHFAVAVARTDPSTRPRPGLSSVGLGPGKLAAIAASSTAVACTLGSTVALGTYLHLRGDITGLPFAGAAAGLLEADQPLPPAAALTLLAILPVTASAAAGLALRPRKEKGGKSAAERRASAVPLGLPWGITLVTAGLAMESWASRGNPSSAIPLPGHPDSSPAGALVGWLLTAFGLAVAGPALTHLCGRLLQCARPGAARLLAGRVLMAEARRIGRPLGVVCAVASAMIAASVLYGDEAGPHPFGPLTGLGAALVTSCTVATLLTAALESKYARGETTAAMLRLGTPAKVLRASAAMRGAAVLAVFAPLTWGIAELAALPLTG
ncbi:hypothetical protein [Streptomyces sp. CBMA152]|uniref:hypothetical protein n=1 Tax=Streptomyces sp. CBMA152 TaxID=1896312 RepID=UPI0016613C88|nr:hypothetical protein [Streptomyces sp. CBMA152]MBD0744485.1 hypothetical protein [Streptomyces sp. CBMA152]